MTTQAESKLKKAGFEEELVNGTIKVENKGMVLIAVEDEEGYLDWDATDALAERVMNTLHWGGYKTAGGHWYAVKDTSGLNFALQDQMGAAAFDQMETPPLPFKCYDCGSTTEGHHTPLCSFADPGDALDLEAVPGTQWWVGANRTPAQAAEQDLSFKLRRVNAQLLEAVKAAEQALLSWSGDLEDGGDSFYKVSEATERAKRAQAVLDQAVRGL